MHRKIIEWYLAAFHGADVLQDEPHAVGQHLHRVVLRLELLGH